MSSIHAEMSGRAMKVLMGFCVHVHLSSCMPRTYSFCPWLTSAPWAYQPLPWQWSCSKMIPDCPQPCPSGPLTISRNTSDRCCPKKVSHHQQEKSRICCKSISHANFMVIVYVPMCIFIWELNGHRKEKVARGIRKRYTRGIQTVYAFFYSPFPFPTNIHEYE